MISGQSTKEHFLKTYTVGIKLALEEVLPKAAKSWKTGNILKYHQLCQNLAAYRTYITLLC